MAQSLPNNWVNYVGTFGLSGLKDLWCLIAFLFSSLDHNFTLTYSTHIHVELTIVNWFSHEKLLVCLIAMVGANQ